MNRCTVCGATSREGAKFCTSCGARLVDENEAVATTTETTDAGTTSATEAADASAQPTTEDESSSAEAEATTSSGDERYASSWPGTDSGGESQEDTEPADTVSDSAEPETPLVTDAGGDTSWPSASAATSGSTPEAPAYPTMSADAGARANGDEDHHGASDWESWAPEASGPSSAVGSTAIDESFVRLHQLLDEMQRRLERVTNPATLASRNLDPDELADQMEKWSRAVPDSDDLLDAVRQVRRSPKDIDALRQLSDRAADLELLVRHYQSITSTSDQWAADLRRNRDDAGDSPNGSPGADQ